MNTLKNYIRIITAAVFAVIFAFALIALKPITRISARAEQITQINLADYYAFRWVDENKASLRDATVYRYRYVYENEWHDYYTTSPLETAPRVGWEAWTLYSAVVAPCSVTEYKVNGGNTVSAVFTGLRTGDYTVSYSGEYSADAEGEYVAKAKITLVNPDYKFVYDPDTAINITGRGMSVAIEADGTATVTKIWYVARYENGFLDEAASLENNEQTPYSIPSWTFGEFPDGGVSAPRLVHGDEVKGLFNQPEGYSLTVEGFDDPVVEIINNDIKWNEQWHNGNNDAVTFTLKLDGEVICEDKIRSEIGYYVNEYMPAGSYEIIFTAKALGLTEHYAWWNDSVSFGTGGSLEYCGFSREYFFEVYPAKLTVTIPESENFGSEITDFKDFDFNGFFASIAEYCTFSDYFARTDLALTNNFWAENAEKYFDEIPLVTFSVTGLLNDYLPADGEWDKYLDQAGTYVICYRAEMRNYVCETDADGYFKITLVGATVGGGEEEKGETPTKSSSEDTAFLAVCSVIIAAAAVFIAFTTEKNDKSDTRNRLLK